MLAPAQVITVSVMGICELALRLAGRESVPVRAVDGVWGEDEPLGRGQGGFHDSNPHSTMISAARSCNTDEQSLHCSFIA